MFIIADRLINRQNRPFIIAELSGNHNGDINKALQMISLAKKAGAGAVKIQTFLPSTITIDHNSDEFYIKDGLWQGQSLYELYKIAHTPWEWHPALFAHAKQEGIILFSTPFDSSAIDLLEGLNTPVYKVASFEIIDLPLIAAIAKTGKPLIISTGMANLPEIAAAIGTVREIGDNPILLMHCISGYPAPFTDCHLQTIPHLAAAFNCEVGLSDHSLGLTAPLCAIALGAVAIEKHFIISRNDGGVDSEFSLEPDEFALLVKESSNAYDAIGRVNYDLKSSESKDFRRSLYVIQNIIQGEVLTLHNIRSIRPGYGLAPKHLPQILGKIARKDLSRGTPLNWDMIGRY